MNKELRLQDLLVAAAPTLKMMAAILIFVVLPGLVPRLPEIIETEGQYTLTKTGAVELLEGMRLEDAIKVYRRTVLP